MTDYSALYREDVTEDEMIACYQALVDSGDAWRLEGHVGRTAMQLIEDGRITLGPEGHRDFYGNYVPSKTEVEPGTKGSEEYLVDAAGLADDLLDVAHRVGEKMEASASTLNLDLIADRFGFCDHCGGARWLTKITGTSDGNLRGFCAKCESKAPR